MALEYILLLLVMDMGMATETEETIATIETTIGIIDTMTGTGIEIGIIIIASQGAIIITMITATVTLITITGIITLTKKPTLNAKKAERKPEIKC